MTNEIKKLVNAIRQYEPMADRFELGTFKTLKMIEDESDRLYKEIAELKEKLDIYESIDEESNKEGGNTSGNKTIVTENKYRGTLD